MGVGEGWEKGSGKSGQRKQPEDRQASTTKTRRRRCTQTGTISSKKKRGVGGKLPKRVKLRRRGDGYAQITDQKYLKD